MDYFILEEDKQPPAEQKKRNSTPSEEQFICVTEAVKVLKQNIVNWCFK